MRLIDVDLFIKHCKEMASIEWNKEVAPYSWAYAYESIIDELEDAPTVDAEPVKRGKWIQETQTNSEGKAYFSCSECSADEFRSIFKEVSYCWNCGAKMESEE